MEAELSPEEIIELARSEKQGSDEAVDLDEESDDEGIEVEEHVWISHEKGKQLLAEFADYVSQFPDSGQPQLMMEQIRSFISGSKISAEMQKPQRKLTEFMPNKRARMD